MICEKAYYPNKTGKNRERLYCMDERVTEFNGKCPLIYWCQVSEKFENTSDMFGCIYREKNDEKKMTIDDAIFEFELMASDKCNGEKRRKYKQISDWLKELKVLKEKKQ